MTERRPILAATLAVGTEVTDGQITDRNSAWISQKLVRAGVQVVEHRVVADDREAIERALAELSARVDLLFVTGGLGPTSDDFTRDLLSKVYERPLEFDEASWQQINEKLGARGIVVREIQKQQCYFPRGSRVLSNPAGTANGFSLLAKIAGREVRVFALPGPPSEIAAVWETNLAQEIDALVPQAERESLRIIRCLGRGESDVAELVEAAIAGSGLRVGYRAHMPYVEVKLWYRVGEKAQVTPVLDRVESALAKWIVNHDDEDVADRWIDAASQGRRIRIRDEATGGTLSERLIQRLRDRKLTEAPIALEIETNFATASEGLDPESSLAAVFETGEDRGSKAAEAAEAEIWIWLSAADDRWVLKMKLGEGPETVLEEKPPYNYKVRSERGRKFITEKALALISQRL